MPGQAGKHDATGWTSTPMAAPGHHLPETHPVYLRPATPADIYGDTGLPGYAGARGPLIDPANPAAGTTRANRRNTRATVSLLCGITAFVMMFTIIGWVISLAAGAVGLITGVTGLAASRTTRTGKGKAATGLILSVLGIAVLPAVVTAFIMWVGTATVSGLTDCGSTYDTPDQLQACAQKVVDRRWPDGSAIGDAIVEIAGTADTPDSGADSDSAVTREGDKQ